MQCRMPASTPSIRRAINDGFLHRQHEIDDEGAFAAYLKETMPLIVKGTADVISPKPARMKCSKGNDQAAS